MFRCQSDKFRIFNWLFFICNTWLGKSLCGQTNYNTIFFICLCPKNSGCCMQSIVFDLAYYFSISIIYLILSFEFIYIISYYIFGKSLFLLSCRCSDLSANWVFFYTGLTWSRYKIIRVLVRDGFNFCLINNKNYFYMI